MKETITSAFRVCLLAACTFAIPSTLPAAERYREKFRPQFHFTPERNWMNDPNGMVYYDGEYHLFYQYNPFGDKWGHMSWGHAVSRDLVHWEHLPIALPEKDGIMIFSGSAVVDWKNTSGFGKDGQPPMVAIYTGHQDKRQDQRIAYSNDRGRTWTQYSGNPVLDRNLADFRDPKVSWHEPTQRWVMVVAVPNEKKVQFYASSDLRAWEHLSDFGPAGATGGIWECPDLLEVPMEDWRGNSKWVLIVNVNPGGPTGGSGCQYFVGEFDGAKFVAEDPKSKPEMVPDGKVFADFEGGDYAGWKVEGEAFGDRPATGTLPRQQTVSGFRGRGLINSYRDGDRPQVMLTSPPFEIAAGHINFLIGGGAFASDTCMNLLVDGKVVRTATGDEREQLAWKSWDVRELRGKQAALQIVDRQSGGWGHINVDHVMLAEEPATAATSGVLWADFGTDIYAAVSWSGVPDGRRILLGWMTNLIYAGDLPTSPWRGAMTVPRKLTLRRTQDGFRLLQQPVAELESLRNSNPLTFSGGTVAEAEKWLEARKNLPPLLDVEIAFDDVSGKKPFTLSLHTGKEEITSIVFEPEQGRMLVDRTKSGVTGFHRAFPSRHSAPLRLEDGRLSVRFLMDTSSLEVFAQGGEVAFTSLIFPNAGQEFSLELSGDETAAPHVTGIKIHELRSAW
jgi:sucrose-6-phosphate hydrolase SacC (GH32 family)